MTNFNNAKRLTTTTLMALACAGFVGCTGQSDRSVTTTTDTTTSNMTVAADDTPKTLDTTGEVPPAAADSSEAKTVEKSSTTTETKKSKHMKHKAKKAHKKDAAAVWTAPDDQYASQDDSVLLDDEYAYDDNIGSTDVSDQYEDTVSGTTMAPDVYRETGLSPFAQEPNSRFPTQIGSGQLTGEDKSTTILDGPGLFQDPAALGRDLIH